MAKRYQHGSLQRKKRGGRLVWLGFWYDKNSKRRSKTLGEVARMTKADAETALGAIVRTVNEQRKLTDYCFGNFLNLVVLPAKRRQWKESTRQTTEDRISRTLLPVFKDCPITAFTREMLQDFLDDLSAQGTAWSIIAHTRWDISLVFKFAHSDGLINRNPAALLHIPDGPTRERHVLTLDQARIVLNAFPLRERLIIKLCGILGLRPGEALATKWADVTLQGLRITRRVYRGVIDTPKSNKGKRIAALSTSVIEDLAEWRNMSPNTAPDDWIFPSENSTTPLWPTNVWYDKIRPTLETLGMTWVNYQVLRRSTASLLNQFGVEGKTVADQLGHGLDVSQNVYTQAGIKQQTNAVNILDNALRQKTAHAAD
jgi:integrase